MVLDHSGTVPDSTAGFSLFARFPVPPVCFFPPPAPPPFAPAECPAGFAFPVLADFVFRRSFFGLYPRRGYNFPGISKTVT
ncbi:MAG: hypothetical protein ACLTQP_01090 [Faecalibacterium prausnitzii]